MIRVPVILLVVVFSSISSPTAFAQAGSGQLGFPGEPMSERRLKTAKKAEAAFEAGDYKDAFWYYSTELAPIGDKYAQYMVGYMTARGLGTQADPVRGAAWYLLAAERGHDPLVNNFESIMADLTPTQKVRAQEIAAELRVEYGDRELVERLIRLDIDRLAETTGSRIRGRDKCSTRSLRVIDPRRFGSMDGSRYCKMLNDRIDSRVAYLTGYIEYSGLELLPDEELDEAASSETDEDETESTDE